MGNPTFWVYPTGAPVLEIELSGASAIASIEPERIVLGAQRRSLSQRVVTSVRAQAQRVTIEVSPVAQASVPLLKSQLAVLTDCMMRGDTIGFAIDKDQAWLSYLAGPPAYGDTTLFMSTAGSVGWNTGATLESGAQIKIETLDRGVFYADDRRTSASVSAGAFTMSIANGVSYGLGAAGWVRHHGFFPALVWEQGTDPASNDRYLFWGWKFSFLVNRALLTGGPGLWESLYTGTDAGAAMPSGDLFSGQLPPPPSFVNPKLEGL